MKQIYVCEKCGAQYEDWSEASRCEDSHRSVEAIEYSHLDQENADGIFVGGLFLQDGTAAPVCYNHPVSGIRRGQRTQQEGRKRISHPCVRHVRIDQAVERPEGLPEDGKRFHGEAPAV